MPLAPLRVVLLFLLLARLSAFAQESISVTIAGGAVLVPVKISNRIFNFLLDTGSSRSVIDPVTAANLGLLSEGTQRIQKNFRDLVVDITEVNTLAIGKQQFNHAPLDELTLAPVSKALGTAVDGVLGSDILQQLTFKLCYSKKTLLIGPLTKLGTLGELTPVRHLENQFFVSVILISMPAQLVLDTGTNSTNLSWKTWENLARVWTPKQIVEGIARAGNPTSQAILVCLPSFQLGNGVLSDQAVRAQQQSDAGVFSSEDFGGILGSDILQQFEITFDLKNNRIFLRPDTLYKRDPYRYVTVGIQIAKNGQGGFEIMSVWKDSPAARAGLQQGDVLKAIDGKPVESFTAEQVSSMLHAKEGTEITLAVEHDAALSTIAVKTHGLLCTHNRPDSKSMPAKK
jgi:PDZ domain/Aspartyl protease